MAEITKNVNIGKNKRPIVLLDTTNKKINAADLEYIPDKRLIIIPKLL